MIACESEACAAKSADPRFVQQILGSDVCMRDPRIIAQSSGPRFAQQNPRMVRIRTLRLTYISISYIHNRCIDVRIYIPLAGTAPCPDVLSA